MVEYDMKTDKRVLIEYRDGTHEFVNPENFTDWKIQNLNDGSEKSKIGFNIKFSTPSAKIIFGF